MPIPRYERHLASRVDPLIAWAPLPRTNAEVIVSGMPKSGTTAIARLFGASAGLSVCSDPFHQLDERGVQFRPQLFSGTLSLETLWRRYRSVFFGSLVKDPNFPMLMDQIANFRPQAKLLFLVRDPWDNIRSILNRLGLPGDLEDLGPGKLPKTWDYTLHGTVPPMPGTNYIENLAWRWRYSAEAYLKHRDRCFLLRYEDFKASKVDVIEQTVVQCGYKPKRSIDDLVDVQYQPKGSATTTKFEFFSTKHFDAISRITESCLDEFHYPQAATD